MSLNIEFRLELRIPTDKRENISMLSVEIELENIALKKLMSLHCVTVFLVFQDTTKNGNK